MKLQQVIAPRPQTSGPATRSQNGERLVSLPQNKSLGSRRSLPSVPVWPAWDRREVAKDVMKRRVGNVEDSASEDNVDAPDDSESEDTPELSIDEAVAAVQNASGPGQQKEAWRSLIWSFAFHRDHPWDFPTWVLGKLDEDVIQQCLMAEFGNAAMEKSWTKARGHGKVVATLARFLDMQFYENLALWFGSDGIQSPTPETLRILISVYDLDIDTDPQVARRAGQSFDYKGLIQAYAERLRLDMANPKHRHVCIFARCTLKRRKNEKGVRLAPKDIKTPTKPSTQFSRPIPGYYTTAKFDCISTINAASPGSKQTLTGAIAGKENAVSDATQAGSSAAQAGKTPTRGDTDDSSARAVPGEENVQGDATRSTPQPRTPLVHHTDERAFDHSVTSRAGLPGPRPPREVTTSRPPLPPIACSDGTLGSPRPVTTTATSPESKGILDRHSTSAKRHADGILEILLPKRRRNVDMQLEEMTPNNKRDLSNNYSTLRGTINAFDGSTINAISPRQEDTEATSAPSPPSNTLATPTTSTSPIESEGVTPIEDDTSTAETPHSRARRERDPFLELTAKDVETLASPTGWLSGSIIDTFLTCFASAKESCGTISGLSPTYPRPEDNIPRAKFPNGPDGTPPASIILCLSETSFHWVVTWIDTEHNQIRLYDPHMACPSPRRINSDLDHVRRLLPQEARDFEIVPAVCPRQPDIPSCGVSALAMSCHLTSGSPFPDTLDPLLWRWVFLAMARNTSLQSVLGDAEPAVVAVSAEVEVLATEQRQQQPVLGGGTTLARTMQAIESAARCVEACIAAYRGRADRAAGVAQRVRDEVRPVLARLAESAAEQTESLGTKLDDARHNAETWRVILNKAQSLRPGGNAVVELEAARNCRLSAAVGRECKARLEAGEALAGRIGGLELDSVVQVLADVVAGYRKLVEDAEALRRKSVEQFLGGGSG